jgi:4-oxalocrotonate tautomerase
MPVIHVQSVSRPTKEQKAQLVREITDTMVRVLGSNPDKTHIIIEDVSTESWGNNGILVADRPAAPAK